MYSVPDASQILNFNLYETTTIDFIYWADEHRSDCGGGWGGKNCFMTLTQDKDQTITCPQDCNSLSKASWVFHSDPRKNMLIEDTSNITTENISLDTITNQSNSLVWFASIITAMIAAVLMAMIVLRRVNLSALGTSRKYSNIPDEVKDAIDENQL